MNAYNRVIPRDFFNEAKLLKCFGVLSLSILDCAVPKGIKITIEESGEPFEIALSDDGMLFLSNYETFVNGQPVTFGTRYNSKRNFPFFCVEPDSGEEADVFDEDGKFTEDFLQMWKTPEPLACLLPPDVEPDDGPKFCPDCDRLSQFGGLCSDCRYEQSEALHGRLEDRKS